MFQLLKLPIQLNQCPYLNHMIYSEDNGRVIGYDNTHNFHHKHHFGEISEVEDFTDYQALVERFEREIKEFIK